MNRPARISFVSLGCPKALVDSERIITRLRAEGYELARDHAGADLTIVNTCGFLDSAQAESLSAIGVVKAFGREDYENRLLEAKSRQTVEIALQARAALERDVAALTMGHLTR